MSAGNSLPGGHWLDQEFSEKHKEKLRLLIVAFVVVFFTSYEHHFDEWVYTQWVLNYDFGLVRRGLIGGLLKALGYVPSPEFYMVAAFVFAAGVGIGLLWLLSRSALLYSKQSTAAFILALFFICHPLTIQHFVQSSGFLDNINFLIVIIGIAAILKTSAKVGAFCVLLAGGLVIPIHEASFVMFAPLLIGVWLHTHKPRIGGFDSLLIVAVAGVLLAEVILVGTSNPGKDISIDDYYNHLLAITKPINKDAVAILFNTLHGNTLQTAGVLLSTTYLKLHLNLLVGLIPTFILASRILKALSAHIRLVSYEALLLIAALSPLALYLIAWDYTRWWSIAMTNAAIALTLLMRDQALAGVITKVAHQQRWFILLATGFGLALGPLTSHLSYRNLNWLYTL